jgi:hypothetical protein
MVRKAYFFLLFAGIFIIFHCDKSTNNGSTGPARVVLLSGVADTSRVERGIDAVPEGNIIRLEWIPGDLNEVAEYELFRSTVRTGSYASIARIAATDSSYQDMDVQPDTRFFYFIRALNREGLQSEPSDTLSYKLILKATDLMPSGIITESRPELSWTDPNNPPKAFYILRITEGVSGDVVWISVVPSSYTGGSESIQFNSDGSATIDSLENGVMYHWRVDVRGSEANSGSESVWNTIRRQ